MKRTDISRELISEKYVQENLVNIFPDSAIVDSQFKIVAIACQVARMLGYESAQLRGTSFQSLAECAESLNTIKTELLKGFFNNVPIVLKGKEQSTISCKLSGFYLGLVSDMNGMIVIRIEVADEAGVLSSQLDASRNELDEFVYRTTHDLRGPLATIRGLINLLKLEFPVLSGDVKNLVSLMDLQAETLDGRLSNLNYVSETAYGKAVAKDLDCAELESTLRSTLEQNMVINADFQFHTQQRYYGGIQSSLATAVLNHLLLYVITLPKNLEPSLIYTIAPANKGMQVTIYAEGFVSNYVIRQVIRMQNPLYTTVVMYSELINFFGAMKNAQRIGATINVDFIDERSQQIAVWIPGE